MKKTKEVKSYTRKSKSGKTVTVKAYSASFEGAEDMAKKALQSKSGAGKELVSAKKKGKKVSDEPNFEEANGFSPDDYKAWYHWDYENDPKNKQAKKVEKALKAKMGNKAYKKYFDDMSESYTARGHNKALKGLAELVGGNSKKADKATKEKKSKATLSKNMSENRSTKISKEAPKNAKDIHKLTSLNRFEEGEIIKGGDAKSAKNILLKSGYIGVKGYLVPPKGKGPLYCSTPGKLFQAGKDDEEDLYSGHNVLSKGDRTTMEKLGYFGSAKNGGKGIPFPKHKPAPKSSKTKFEKPAIKGLFKKDNDIVGNGWGNVDKDYLRNKIEPKITSANFKVVDSVQGGEGIDEYSIKKYKDSKGNIAYLSCSGGGPQFNKRGEETGKYAYGNVDIYRGGNNNKHDEYFNKLKAKKK